MRIRILDRHWKKWIQIRIQVISLRFTEFFLPISLFSKGQIWVLGGKNFFWQVLVDSLPLGSGSVDPHIFVDPDPGSQNLADPTDPDPKHW